MQFDRYLIIIQLILFSDRFEIMLHGPKFRNIAFLFKAMFPKKVSGIQSPLSYVIFVI